MIFFTQLVYIREEKQQIFEAFEAMAIPLIRKYNGELLLRLRPKRESYVECNIDEPYEIHFGLFCTEDDFKQYLEDEERKSFIHLKEESIKSSVVIKGQKLENLLPLETQKDTY